MREKITFTAYDEKGDEEEISLNSKWEVCSRCDGEGKYVNPAIDEGGISAETFAEDPEFKEAYFSGVYDIPCERCKGKRVVAVADPDNNDEGDMKKYHKHLEEEEYRRRERESELRWGY